MLWKPEFTVNMLLNSEQLLHVAITHVSWSSEVRCSFVYAKCIATERRGLWNDLLTLSTNLRSRPWIVGGDFNVIASEDEYLGCAPQDL